MKDAKKAIVYAIPFFILAWIIGLVLGATLFAWIGSFLAGLGAEASATVQGILSLFFVWLVWLKADMPKHLAKYAK